MNSENEGLKVLCLYFQIDILEHCKLGEKIPGC